MSTLTQKDILSVRKDIRKGWLYFMIVLFLIFISVLLSGCASLEENPVAPIINQQDTVYIYVDDTTFVATDDIMKAVNYTWEIALLIRSEINAGHYNDVQGWVNDNFDNYFGLNLQFAKIMNIGLDDSNGIRIKFYFYYNGSTRNISVNVFTLDTWIGFEL